MWILGLLLLAVFAYFFVWAPVRAIVRTVRYRREFKRQFPGY